MISKIFYMHILGSCSDVNIQVTLKDKLSRVPVKVQLAPLPMKILCSVVRVLQR